MKSWRNLLAIALTGAMIATALPVQSFAMEELTAEPVETIEMTASQGMEEGSESEELLLLETEEGIPEQEEDALLLDADHDTEISVEETLVEPEEQAEDTELLEAGEASEVSDAVFGEDALTAGDELEDSFPEMVGTVYSGTSERGIGWSFDSATGTLTYTPGKEETTITEFDFPGGSGDLPEDYDTYNRIKYIKISDGITEIDDDAFYSVETLKGVYMADSVVSIGRAAFEYCKELESIRLSSNLESIGAAAFSECRKLKTITLPESILEIGNHAFTNCENLKTIIVQSQNDISLGESSFGYLMDTDQYNPDLTIYCYEGTTVEENAKEKGISYKLIGQQAFNGTCGDHLNWEISLESSTLIIRGYGPMDDYLTSAPGWAKVSSDIEKIVIEQGVTSVGAYAFAGYSKVTSVSLADSVSSIGNYAFSNMNSLSEITIPNKNISIGMDAIGYLFGDDGGTYTRDGFIIRGYSGTGAETYALRNQITFAALDKEEVLSGTCGPLANWTFTRSTGTLVISGSRYTFDYDTVAPFLPPWKEQMDASEITSIVVEEGIDGIGTYAFYGLSNVTSMTISSSSISVSDHGCQGLSSLKEVNFPGNELGIGAYAFADCTSLSTVHLSEGTYGIGEFAFSNCTSLHTINFPAMLDRIGECAFFNCPSLKKVTSLSRVESSSSAAIGSMALGYFSGTSDTEVSTSKVENFTICAYPKSALRIYAQENGFLFEEIPYPVSGSAGSNATWNYDAATKTLTIQGTGEIKDWDSYYMPESEYTALPADWFAWAHEVEKIVIGEGITSIGMTSFYDCSNVTSVQLPETLKEIHTGSFARMEKLTEITIPRGVTMIERWAFYHSSSLKTIYGYGGTAAESYVAGIDGQEMGFQFVDLDKMSAIAEETVTIDATYVGPGYITITWPTASEAEYYRIYRRAAGGSTALVKTVNASTTRYIDKDVTVGTTYYYFVVGIYHTAKSGTQSKAVTYKKVGKVAAKLQASSMVISWPASSGIDGYRLYRKDSAGSITRFQVGAGKTSYTDKTVVSGKTYTYTLQAYKGRDVVVYEAKTVLYLAAPSVTISNGTQGVQMSWSKITGAKGYYIYRKSGTASYSRIASLGSGVTSYTDTSAGSGTTYKYAVRAYNGNMQSAYTEKSILYLKATTPTLSNTVTGIQVKWTAVNGAKGYYVFRKTGSGSYSRIATVSSALVSYTDKTTIGGTSYTYAVRAYNGTTQSNHIGKTIRRLEAPQVTATRLTRKTRVLLSWKKISGATGYVVYRKSGTGSYEKIATISSGATVSYTDTNASLSVKYTYAVRATNGTTQSAYIAAVEK